MIIDGKKKCNMEDEIFNVSFQIEQNTIEQINAKIITLNEKN
jgi:hypothetical protein